MERTTAESEAPVAGSETTLPRFGQAPGAAREEAQERLEDELATLSAHIAAATARFLELAGEAERAGLAAADGFARWLAFRCGISGREAHELVRVGQALQELPAIRAAFSRGELTFTKVRALTRVATRSSEQGLLELASALSANQLERALRAFRRLGSEEARASHELEYLDYYWAEDGSLFLRARLPAEEGTLVVKALAAARERVRERRRQEQASGADSEGAAACDLEPPRAPLVEALVEVAQSALASPSAAPETERASIVVHVDAAALAQDGAGRSELDHGPVLSPETARRLGCDAETVAVVERDGLPLSVGRRHRTVPPTLRRCSKRGTAAAAASRDASGAVTSPPTIEPTGQKAARRASTTSSCSVSSTTASSTKAGTRSRTQSRASFASATATASCARRCRAPRPGARRSSSS